MRYAALRDPASLPITGRVLAIPAKRFDRPVLGYLSREQVTAILAAPDRRTWSGHRDQVLLATAYNTAARVSEITALRVRDVLLDRQTAVHLHGKGRKQRAIPLWKNTATELRGWLDRINPEPNSPVFPNRAGAPLTRSGVRDRLNRAVTVAEQRCPSLHGQHVTPHTHDQRGKHLIRGARKVVRHNRTLRPGHLNPRHRRESGASATTRTGKDLGDLTSYDEKTEASGTWVTRQRLALQRAGGFRLEALMKERGSEVDEKAFALPFGGVSPAGQRTRRGGHEIGQRRRTRLAHHRA